MEGYDIIAGTRQVFIVRDEHQFFFDTIVSVLRV